MLKNNNSTAAIRVACAIVFCLFTFCYMYFYQSDIMYVEQHVLSGGKTHYDRTIGAVLITVVLYLLQLGVFSMSRLYGCMYAITYFPSLLVLAVLTDYSPDKNGVFSFGVWPWLGVLLLVAYAFLVFVGRQLQAYEPETRILGGIFSRKMWINLLTMTVMFFFVGMVGNGNDVMRYRMKMESTMMRGDYASALEIGEKSMATDSSLTMLRIYALAKTGQIGDRLFCYPLEGNGTSMIPDGRSIHCFMYPEKKIIRFSKSRGVRDDYRLCSYLLDKKLDAFASEIVKSKDSISSSLPKHYREALILYAHTRSNPLVVYHEDVMDADYEDLQNLEKESVNEVIRESNVRDVYGKTYWYYYLYGGK